MPWKGLRKVPKLPGKLLLHWARTCQKTRQGPNLSAFLHLCQKQSPVKLLNFNKCVCFLCEPSSRAFIFVKTVTLIERRECSYLYHILPYSTSNTSCDFPLWTQAAIEFQGLLFRKLCYRAFEVLTTSTFNYINHYAFWPENTIFSLT